MTIDIRLRPYDGMHSEAGGYRTMHEARERFLHDGYYFRPAWVTRDKHMTAERMVAGVEEQISRLQAQAKYMRDLVAIRKKFEKIDSKASVAQKG